MNKSKKVEKVGLQNKSITSLRRLRSFVRPVWLTLFTRCASVAITSLPRWSKLTVNTFC
jgi:hypothetical protein